MLWFREKSSRSPPDVLVAVAYEARGGSIITVFASLLLPVEPEDELAWLKLPMAAGGVLLFVLFKLCGAKKPKAPNTPAGTYSKYGSRRSGDELNKLREKLSQIENS